jgi:hypothetical protein
MIECFQKLWCKRFHERCHRRIGWGVMCGRCGRISPRQDVGLPTPYSPSLWFSSEMIVHVDSDRMEGFLESRAGTGGA